MKYISLLFYTALGAVCVAFFFANRQSVAISLDPVNVENPSIATPLMPLWVWLMTFLLIGLGVGAVGMWLSGRPRRRKLNLMREELKTLKKENEILAARSTSEVPVIVSDG